MTRLERLLSKKAWRGAVVLTHTSKEAKIIHPESGATARLLRPDAPDRYECECRAHLHSSCTANCCAKKNYPYTLFREA